MKSSIMCLGRVKCCELVPAKEPIFYSEVTVFDGRCDALESVEADSDEDERCGNQRPGVVEWYAEEGTLYWLYIDG